MVTVRAGVEEGLELALVGLGEVAGEAPPQAARTNELARPRPTTARARASGLENETLVDFIREHPY
jgi:hypothetical protein